MVFLKKLSANYQTLSHDDISPFLRKPSFLLSTHAVPFVYRDHLIKSSANYQTLTHNNIFPFFKKNFFVLSAHLVPYYTIILLKIFRKLPDRNTPKIFFLSSEKLFLYCRHTLSHSYRVFILKNCL